MRRLDGLEFGLPVQRKGVSYAWNKLCTYSSTAAEVELMGG
jgi:hypothetical protein